MSLIKAERIEDIYRAFDPNPLRSTADIDRFYVEALNSTRGSDKVQVLALGLKRKLGSGFYKAFVMGHSGVGISTELSRLQDRVSGQVRVFRLSASTDLDPQNFKPFDVVLRIAIGLAEETAKSVVEGGAGSIPPADLARELLDWFAAEKVTAKTGYDVTIKGEAGFTAPSLWKKLTGLFATLKLEAKRSSGRTREVIEYREKNVGQLTELANKLIDDCNQRLKRSTGMEWLVIGDDFDKPGIPENAISALFITYANILSDLKCHIILDIPIGLGHSSRANQLPAQFEGPFNFPDTPVYTQKHEPHEAGRSALRQVIQQRMNTGLFDAGQEERLIVASGGNLRDLFTLIVTASTNAELRQSNPGLIIAEDVTAAIADLRKEYRDHLSLTSYDTEKTDIQSKLQKLTAVYLGKPEAELHDAALYSLLHARAVQEFNGKSWFGVHPLIVDFMSRLDDEALRESRDPNTGLLPGGTV